MFLVSQTRQCELQAASHIERWRRRRCWPEAASATKVTICSRNLSSLRALPARCRRWRADQELRPTWTATCATVRRATRARRRRLDPRALRAPEGAGQSADEFAGESPGGREFLVRGWVLVGHRALFYRRIRPLPTDRGISSWSKKEPPAAAASCGKVQVEIGVPARWAWHDHRAGAGARMVRPTRPMSAAGEAAFASPRGLRQSAGSRTKLGDVRGFKQPMRHAGSLRAQSARRRWPTCRARRSTAASAASRSTISCAGGIARVDLARREAQTR